MPTHALLGATGQCGSSILRYLLSNPPTNKLTLNILVRSKSKLLAAFPDLESTTSIKINIIEGTSTSIPALRECLRNASLVYMCIASNYGGPGTSLVADTAAAIIDALKETKNVAPPTILQLRSATLNEPLARGTPAFVRHLLHWCLKYIYDDLENAAKLYDAQPASLLRVIYMDAPALHDPEGTERTGYKLILESVKGQNDVVSYADLGAAMVEVGEREEEFVGKGVGVVATGKLKLTWGVLFGYLLSGAWTRVFG